MNSVDALQRDTEKKTLSHRLYQERGQRSVQQFSIQFSGLSTPIIKHDILVEQNLKKIVRQALEYFSASQVRIIVDNEILPLEREF